jgi:hypothetical protein
MLRLLYPRERDPVAIVQDGWSGRARQNSPPAGFELQTVHPVMSCCTDYIILAAFLTVVVCLLLWLK